MPTLSTAAWLGGIAATNDALHRHDELCRDISRIGAAIGHRAAPAGPLKVTSQPGFDEAGQRPGDPRVVDLKARMCRHAVDDTVEP